MTSINQPAVYVTVPIPLLPNPAPQGASPLPKGAHRKSTAQRKNHPEGATSPSCTYQEHNFLNPSDIAKDALIRLIDLPKQDQRHQYDQICTDFVKYLDQCEQKGFMIKGYDTRKGKVLNLPLSYNNRWGPVRRRELSDKLERLNFWFEMQEDRPCTMITLTSYQKKRLTKDGKIVFTSEGEKISDAWADLQKSKKKLQKIIANHLGNVDYFWVAEPHQSGYVHYHMAVFADISNNVKDKNGRGLEDKLRYLWAVKYKTGSHSYGLDFSQKKDDNKIQHLKNYLSKYLEKGFLMKSWSIGMLIFNAHLWETGYRIYGASKNIRDMMNIKDDKPTDTVWLETRMQTVELTADNEEIPVDEVVWNRDYIPDWIDNSFWVRESNMIDWQWWHNIKLVVSNEARDKIYHCNWGRTYKGMKYFEQNIPKLKRSYLSNTSTEEQDRRKEQRQKEEEYNKVQSPQLSERQRRKLEQDGYL